MIHVCIPYRTDRNLGKAYNDAFKMIGANDWLCITDYDVLFLLPDTIKHLYEYVERYPKADVFTCFANRSHVNSKQQLLGETVSNITDMNYHIQQAKTQTKFLYEATEIHGNISGYLMMLSKKLWKEIPFVEDMKCLGVDTMFSQRLREKGKKIFRMDGIMVWHTYRLANGVKDKSHLL